METKTAQAAVRMRRQSAMNKLIDAVRKSASGEIQALDSDTIAGRFCFPDDFPGFSGHFPGYPILPAVVQLIASMCLIEEQKGHPLRLDSVQNAKFLQEIRPGNEILIKCMDRMVKGVAGSRVEIISGDKIAASFFMTFSG
jgi:3-hydroxyacyl-[acyl-carrier-protein] dehydratase